MLVKRDPWTQFEECLTDILGEMEKMLQTTSNGKKTITAAKQQKLKEIKAKLFDATDTIKRHTEDHHNSMPPPSMERANTERMERMEGDIEEIKKALTTITSAVTRTRTWADVAAGRGSSDIDAERAKKERLERAKQLRAKTEVVIGFHQATDEIKETLHTATDQYVQSTIDEHIQKITGSNIKIRGIQRPTKLTVKLMCRSEEEARIIREVDWAGLGGGKTVKQMYGIVIHGVSKTDVDANAKDNMEIKEILEAENDIKVARIAPLTRRPRNPQAPTQSIVLFTESPEDANNMIRMGLKTQDGRIHAAERYTPQCQIKQCYRCQGYGHKATVCTKAAKCGKCAGEHETRECNTENPKPRCIHCNGEHPAWHTQCPHRQNEQKRLEALRVIIPRQFGVVA